MGRLKVKRTVDEKKDHSVDVTWVIPRWKDPFASTMFYAALRSSMQRFDALLENFSYTTTSVNIIVKMHFISTRLYIQFIDYVMDNYPELFFEKDGNLKSEGGML